MGLSKHADGSAAILKELESLDEKPVLLDGKPVKASGCYRLSGNPPQVIYNTNCPEELKQQVETIISKYREPSAGASYYSIAFDDEDIHYTGRLTPEFKKGHEQPSSWHVVLNEVFFGYLHKDGDQWEVSEQRPARLTEKVGQLIDNEAYQPHVI